MSSKVTLELPDSVSSILRLSPEEFARELRLATAVKWYEPGKISQSKAAELAGLSRQAFLDALGRFEISPSHKTIIFSSDSQRSWSVTLHRLSTYAYAPSSTRAVSNPSR